jgi:hypothetical protein
MTMVSHHHRDLVRHLLHHNHHHHHRVLSPLLCRFYCDAPGTNKLRDVWPLLEDRFRDLVRDNQERLFELLPMSHQAALLQRVVTNKINDTETTNKVAAVLVLLISVDGRPSLVFTRRSAHLSQHAAQISFPGGHYDAALDGDVVDDDGGDNKINHRHLIRTALREAQAELYPPRPPDDNDGSSAAPSSIHDFWTTHVKILGVGTPLPSIRGVLVHPVFADLLVDDDDNFTSTTIATMWPGHPDEVDQVFTVPVCDLLANETTQYLPATRFNPSDQRAPVYPTLDGTIWGLTAHILRPTLHRLFRPILCCRRHQNDDEHEQQQEQQEQPSNQQ